MKNALQNLLIAFAAFSLAFFLFRPKEKPQPAAKTTAQATPAAASAPGVQPEPEAPAYESGCAAGCRETFGAPAWAAAAWSPDAPEDSMPFSDNGSFFRSRNHAFKPPAAFRLSAQLGQNGFLSLESYSRRQKNAEDLFSIVDDPQKPGNRVLMIRSPEHTDATLLRTTRALGSQYQICARIGFIDFGTGDGANGYNGQERNEPWTEESANARNENGCYISAVYRSIPRPHNNAVAHYERLAFIDTDNNTEGWSSIWDAASQRYFKSGWHPIMMGISSGGEEGDGENGPAFRSFSAGDWNRPGQLFAADAYKENTWYDVCMTRNGNTFAMSISGDFRYGGKTAYVAMADNAGEAFEEGKPQYWLTGDPHINYYEGSMLVDDVVLTTPAQNP